MLPPEYQTPQAALLAALQLRIQGEVYTKIVNFLEENTQNQFTGAELLTIIDTYFEEIENRLSRIRTIIESTDDTNKNI